MREDSPPPFIVIRTPKPDGAAREDASGPTVYDRSLELVGLVQTVLDHASARFHLKDRLDRAATALVFELAKTRQLSASQRWRPHRAAQQHANDCATILDILRHQRAGRAADLEAARRAIDELLAALAALG